jgi:hypothetical protein|nr:hypothetical protein [Neorhizobium tomejilense]
MTPLNVILLAEGIFEIISPFLGKRDYRITHDGVCEHRPWKVISEIGNSGVWREEDTFQSLDEALDWAVSLATETFPVPGYGVTLPCGSFLSRPGNVKIEDVMAGMGWAYVVSAMGYSPVKYPKGTSEATVRAYFEDLVEDTAAILGSVDICSRDECEDENNMDSWVADIVVPIYEFVRTENLIQTFTEAFENEGVTTTGHFDWNYRTNVAPHTAEVLDFESAFAAREALKAPVKSNELVAEKAAN